MSDAPPSDHFLPERGSDWIELLRQLPGFVMITSGPDHVVEFVNAGMQKLARYRAIVGQRLRDALPELVDQGFVYIRDEVYRTGTPYRGHATPFKLRRSQDGPLESGYIDFVYQPIKRADGAVCGIIFAGYDITEHKLAEDRVRSLQAELFQKSKIGAMNAMATTMAHELNQPLAAIQNYAAAAKRILRGGKAASGHDVAMALDAIESASQRAGDIIRSAREMAAKRRPRAEPVELAPLIEEAMGMALVDAAQLEIACRADLQPGLVVGGDRIQLLQVLLNLLRNAVDAMRECERRHLEIVAAARDEEAEICVSDTGSGLSGEVRERLFDPFLTTKEEGIGIGLSISRTIVEAHGGKIWAEDGESGGTIFCLMLPLYREPADETEA